MPYWIVWDRCGCRGSSRRLTDQAWSTRIVIAVLLPNHDQKCIKGLSRHRDTLILSTITLS